MKIDVLTLFPELFTPFLNTGIIKRGMDKHIIDINIINIRDFSLNKHKKVDDYPYGGGPGMVMTPQPIYRAYQSITKATSDVPLIYLSPQGEMFNQEKANTLSQYKHIILLCGHYEGIDQRIIDSMVTHEISIGDYVLTGGELPAMIMVDCISRLIPGMLGNDQSAQEDSISNGLLEFPQYTRPYEFNGKEVPSVLLSGNHKQIDRWRRKKSLLKTKEKRPDLFQQYELSREDYTLLLNEDENEDEST